MAQLRNEKTGLAERLAAAETNARQAESRALQAEQERDAEIEARNLTERRARDAGKPGKIKGPEVTQLDLNRMGGGTFSSGFIASISGRVTDQIGAIIPGVAIIVTNLTTKGCISTISSKNGDSFVGLAPGHYKMGVATPGFKTIETTFTLSSRRRAIRIRQLEMEVGPSTTLRMCDAK